MSNELTKEQLQDLTSKVNSLLSSTELDDVSAESSGSRNAPQGYFLCEVVSAELKLSKKGDPQVAFRFKIVEDGFDDGESLEQLKKTKGINIYKYYRLVDETDLKRFISDMLKFEVNDKGESLPKDAFGSADLIQKTLEIVTGLHIYVHVTYTKNTDGSMSSWTNLMTWKRAAELELPC